MPYHKWGVARGAIGVTWTDRGQCHVVSGEGSWQLTSCFGMLSAEDQSTGSKRKSHLPRAAARTVRHLDSLRPSWLVELCACLHATAGHSPRATDIRGGYYDERVLRK
jgi:hypothetical protein